jgi:hypothetical protein
LVQHRAAAVESSAGQPEERGDLTAQVCCRRILTLALNGAGSHNPLRRAGYHGRTRAVLVMLTPSTRLRLQGIVQRIGANQAVSLDERIYLQKFADRDHSVATWLRQARRQQQVATCEGVDRLMAQLDLGELDPGPSFRPDPEDPGDLGDWFGQAPNWLRRS